MFQSTPQEKRILWTSELASVTISDNIDYYENDELLFTKPNQRTFCPGSFEQLETFLGSAEHPLYIYCCSLWTEAAIQRYNDQLNAPIGNIVEL